MFRAERFWAVEGVVGKFCSGFVRLPLQKCRFCHAGSPAEVVRVKGCPHVFQAMPGQGRNLGFAASAKDVCVLFKAVPPLKVAMANSSQIAE